MFKVAVDFYCFIDIKTLKDIFMNISIIKFTAIKTLKL